jgi:hypothetical protein
MSEGAVNAGERAAGERPDPRGHLSLEAPLVRLVERLAGGRELSEMVRTARFRRRKKERKGQASEL